MAAHASWGHLWLVVKLAALVFLANRYRIPLLANRVFVFLGAVSYSFYLIHQNIGYIVIQAGYRWGLSGNVAIVLATIVAIALASFLTFAIERPANRLIRRRYKAWKTGRRTSLSFAG